MKLFECRRRQVHIVEMNLEIRLTIGSSVETEDFQQNVYVGVMLPFIHHSQNKIMDILTCARTREVNKLCHS